MSGLSRRSPLAYFALTIALSVPFWVAGALTETELLPAIPTSALMVVAPAAAASLLVYREARVPAVVALWKRAFDLHRVRRKVWYLPTIAWMPAVMALSWVALRVGGVEIPLPQLSPWTTALLFITFFAAAVGEELGWSAYVIDPLEDRLGALGGALALGAFCVAWHVIPLLQAQRSVGFIAWWSVGTVASRVLIAWLYGNTGRSVFVVILFHTMLNLAWACFPIEGSYYDPRVTSAITAASAFIVVAAGGLRRRAERRTA